MGGFTDVVESCFSLPWLFSLPLSVHSSWAKAKVAGGDCCADEVYSLHVKKKKTKIKKKMMMMMMTVTVVFVQGEYLEVSKSCLDTSCKQELANGVVEE